MTHILMNFTSMRLLLAVALIVCHATAAYADDEFSSLLKAEWEMLAKFDTVDRSYTVDKSVRINNKASKHESDTRYEVHMTEGCGRLQSEKVVLCWNSQYAFNLKKPKGTRTGEWLLGKLVVAPPSSNTLKRFFFTNGHDLCLYKPLTAFFGATCNECLTDGSLRLTNHLREGGMVRAQFELDASLGGDETTEKEHFTGTMVMDPSAHYVVTETIITRKVLPRGMTEEGRHLKLTRAVEKTRDALTATSVNYGTLTGGKDDNFATLNRYSNYRFAATDPKEFRVSNYGIPEPPEVTWERPTPRYAWFLLAAAVFGVVAAVSGYFRRRAIRASVHSQEQL